MDPDEILLVQEAKRCSDIGLYCAPWVSGTRASAYHGPVSAFSFSAYVDMRDRSRALGFCVRLVLASLQHECLSHGGNSVVGVELEADPFAEDEGGRQGLRIRGIGTAARLEYLWSPEPRPSPIWMP